MSARESIEQQHRPQPQPGEEPATGTEPPYLVIRRSSGWPATRQPRPAVSQRDVPGAA